MIADVFNEHKGDSDFFLSTSMTSNLSQAKQILYNVIYSNKGEELQQKFSTEHNWEKNLVAAPLMWQKGDDVTTNKIVVEETKLEPDKITEVQKY